VARALLEHAEELLDRGFQPNDVGDGFEKAAGWCVKHKTLTLPPELIMSVSRAVMKILTGDKKVKDADGLGVALRAQQNPGGELGQAEGGGGDLLDVPAGIGKNPLNDDVRKSIWNSILLLRFFLIMSAHLNYFLNILGDGGDLQ